MNVRKFFWEAGIFPNIKGYRYCLLAIEEIKKEPKIKAMKLYENIAKKHNAKIGHVERAIRTVIKKIDKKHFNALGLTKVPKVSEFMHILAEVFDERL